MRRKEIDSLHSGSYTIIRQQKKREEEEERMRVGVFEEEGFIAITSIITCLCAGNFLCSGFKLMS